MKKTYIQPQTESLLTQVESLLTTASPGASGDYDPTKPIESKGDISGNDEDDDWGNVWK